MSKEVGNLEEQLTKHVANVIRKKRKELKLTQQELADKLGVSRSTITNYERAYRTPMQNDLFALANVFKISVDELFPPKDFEEEKRSVENSIEVFTVPILNSISAGAPMEAVENIIGYTPIANTLNNKHSLFALKVRGDSMDREFKENDIVIVEKDAPIKDNDIAIVIVNGYDATVKRVRFRDDEIVLIPNSNNDMHLPQVYKLDDDIILVGKVVSAQKFY